MANTNPEKQAKRVLELAKPHLKGFRLKVSAFKDSYYLVEVFRGGKVNRIVLNSDLDESINAGRLAGYSLVDWDKEISREPLL